MKVIPFPSENNKQNLSHFVGKITVSVYQDETGIDSIGIDTDFEVEDSQDILFATVFLLSHPDLSTDSAQSNPQNIDP